MEWPMLEQIYLIFSRIFDGFINFLNNTHITIKDAHSLINRNPIATHYFPGNLIIILDLHYLVAFPK